METDVPKCQGSIISDLTRTVTLTGKRVVVPLADDEVLGHIRLVDYPKDVEGGTDIMFTCGSERLSRCNTLFLGLSGLSEIFKSFSGLHFKWFQLALCAPVDLTYEIDLVNRHKRFVRASETWHLKYSETGEYDIPLNFVTTGLNVYFESQSTEPQINSVVLQMNTEYVQLEKSSERLWTISWPVKMPNLSRKDILKLHIRGTCYTSATVQQEYLNVLDTDPMSPHMLFQS